MNRGDRVRVACATVSGAIRHRLATVLCLRANSRIDLLRDDGVRMQRVHIASVSPARIVAGGQQ